MRPSSDLHPDRSLQKAIRVTTRAATGNLRWLREHMPPYFFVTMRDEEEALAGLATNLHSLQRNRHLILVEQEKELILARLDVPGSIYETLERNQDREASYAEITHSDAPVPGAEHPLEIQRFEFDRKADADVAAATDAAIPPRIRRETLAALKANYPPIASQECEKLLR
ncbi:MAG: glutamate dehydrogenase, partial [candidate division NC10 bacterium]|nr:glutamate dehydrogenase [candidate division NC10 bacterium]